MLAATNEFVEHRDLENQKEQTGLSKADLEYIFELGRAGFTRLNAVPEQETWA